MGRDHDMRSPWWPLARRREIAHGIDADRIDPDRRAAGLGERQREALIDALK